VLGLVLLGAAAAQAQTDCSILGQNSFVKSRLDLMYLWYRELPDLDPAAFDSPESYLDAARFRPLDESFSFIGAKQEQEAYYSDSQYVGIGFSQRRTGLTELRISQVFPDSPASDIGLARGDRLLEIDGRPVPELLLTGEINGAFGPSEIGITVELVWRTLSGEERRATVIKRLVTIPTVSQSGVFDVDGRPVGYVHFRNFVWPSVSALDAVFTELNAAGVEDLILDLRYNGGGLVSVAEHLGGLIGGTLTADQVFARVVHNDKNTFRNTEDTFRLPDAAMGANRLVVITTRASASASEMVINALRPFIPVTIIGDATFGKPVGQYGFEFCEKILYPVSFTIRNALNEGDYFGGFAPDCAAADDLDFPLGEATEKSLSEALHFLRTGACSSEVEAAARAHARLAEQAPPIARDGWQQILNAH
jgi:C-terminal processing protease CtpA/Prc